MTGRALTSLDVADTCGITYRQLDHWLRKGYLRGPVDTGSGYGRRWTDTEVAEARQVAAFVRVGVRPEVASALVILVRPGAPLCRVGDVVLGYWPAGRHPPDPATVHDLLDDDEPDEGDEGATNAVVPG